MTSSAAAPTRDRITGLLLAGGRGRRMGGIDKGLLQLDGEPLALHVLRRLRPQVDSVLISANRNAAVYEQWAPVVPDPDPQAFDGPLAGIAAALRRIGTDWLAVAPCDLPLLPLDAVARLAHGLAGASVAFAAPDGAGHSLVCLVHRYEAARLARLQAEGRRRVIDWFSAAGAVAVPFADRTAFSNLNSPDSLPALERR